MARIRSAFAVVLLAASCHSLNNPSDNPINLDNTSNGHTVSVAPGDTIEITLQTIGPGEYETPSVSSGSIRYLGEFPAGPPNPGGPRQLFRFEAVTVDPPGPQTPPFVVTVDVR
jgi:hypothetical protein